MGNLKKADAQGYDPAFYDVHGAANGSNEPGADIFATMEGSRM
jgi:hypothetical protein